MLYLSYLVGLIVFRRINHKAKAAENLVTRRFAVGLRIVFGEFESDDIDTAIGNENVCLAVFVRLHHNSVVIDDIGNDFNVWHGLSIVENLYGQIVANIELCRIF